MERGLKDGPAKRIEHLVLRFHPRVTSHPQSNSACVLRRADMGRYTEISSADWAVLSRLDGAKTVSDLIRERLEQGGGFGLLALLNRIADLQIKGFLIPESEPIRPDRKFGVWSFGFRLPLPQSVSGTKQVWPWVGVLLLSALLAVSLLMTGTFKETAMRDPALTLSAIWGSVCIVLSLRSILALLVLVQAGTWPWRVGVAWNGVAPFFFLDPRDLQVAGKAAKIALALSELSAAPLVIAAVYGANLRGFIPVDVALGAIAGTLITFWCMFRPFGSGPLMGLAGASADKQWTWKDARAYLTQRLWRRTFERGGLFPSERLLILLALVYPLWGYVGFVLFGQALQNGFFLALYTILRQSGESPVGAWILFGALLIGIVITIGGACLWILWWLIRVGRERRSGKTKSPNLNEVDTLVEILADVPFFAILPQDTLRLIASDSRLIDLPSRAFGVRQDTPGDQFFIVRKGKMAVFRRYESGRQEQVAELLPGDAFGETALLMDIARTASVQALERSQVISISRHAFERAMETSSLKKEEVTLWLRLSQQLRHIPLFSEMRANEVAYFLKRSQRRPVPSGEVLIHEGDVGSHFYVVLSGKFEVSKKGNPIGTLTANDFVGEIALLSPVPRTATVTALENAQVLELTRNAFFETLSLNFAFGSKIIETAHRRRKGGIS
ncbi:MAG: cyclic nucleotide-binding domain-containing protein [Nitrospirae bacterium]|nr:cyclic nucleotide-binding domain-containing protein [Candidatus Troglogloeales bacterium]